MPLASIQYCRALAALMVVACHLGRMRFAAGFVGRWSEAGVDVFFVVSGFIMHWTTCRPMTPEAFLRRRLVRIVPLYWAVTSVLVAVLAVAPALVRSDRFDFAHVAASYLFFPWTHPVLGWEFPVLVPGWTLNYEMFFYVVFAACLGLPERRRFPMLALALGTLVAAGLAFTPAQAQLRFYTSSLLLEFLFGVGLGLLVARGTAMPAWLALLAAPLAVAAFPLLDGIGPQGVAWGLPAAALVYALVSLEVRGRMPRIAVLLLIGNASYSLYLIHPIAISAIDQALQRLGIAPAAPAAALGLLLAVLAAIVSSGLLCYRLVELPLGDLVGRLAGLRRPLRPSLGR